MMAVVKREEAWVEDYMDGEELGYSFSGPAGGDGAKRPAGVSHVPDLEE